MDNIRWKYLYIGLAVWLVVMILLMLWMKEVYS